MWADLHKDYAGGADLSAGFGGNPQQHGQRRVPGGRLDKVEALVSEAMGELGTALKEPAADTATLKTVAVLHNTLAMALRGREKIEVEERAIARPWRSGCGWLKLEPNDLEARTLAAGSHSNLAALMLAKQPAGALEELTPPRNCWRA